jgi:hypothetical protein
VTIHFTLWDYLLAGAVTGQAVLMAYLHHPRWKALVLSLPLPFTMACLSLGRPLDATHMAGFILFLAYAHAVRLLYRHCSLPIVAAIAIPALSYAAIAALLAKVLPSSPATFWSAAGINLLIAFGAYRLYVPAEEPGHRTSLPVWLKLPIIAAVVLGLILSKQYLRGFMTVFPMVGLVGAYEARHSLGIICRQVPIFTMCMLPMLMAMRLTQTALLARGVEQQTAIGASLILGWFVYLSILLPVERRLWRRHYRIETEE